MSPLDDIVRPLAALGPAEVTCWTGAGVSLDAPSCLPAAEALTRRAFALYFDSGPDTDSFGTVMAHHRSLGWTAPQICDRSAGAARPGTVRLPRLETVLGVADRVLGDDHRALRLLADLRTAPPNRLHRFFAHHLRAGGRHVTANFDDCVERAHEGAFAAPPGPEQLLHFHGSVRDDPRLGTLGATLARIEAGFAADEARRLTRALRRAPAVVVAGYSGSDFFDVDDLLAALPADALRGQRVTWVNHGVHTDRGADWHQVPRGRQPAMAGLLRAAGAEVAVVCGPTADFFAALAAAWSLPALAAPGRRTTWCPDVPVSHAERIAARLALYRALGLVGEVGAMLAEEATRSAVPPAQARWALSELLWEKGRWGELRRVWSRGVLPAGIDPVHRAERIGACLWVQGRLLPAYVWLHRHRRGAAAPAAARVLMETEGRVLEHMALVPGMKLLSRLLTPGFLRALQAHLPDSDVHLRRRLLDVSSSLRALAAGAPRRDDRADGERTWFAETGNLLGWLNYHHRLLRDTYAPDRPDGELGQDYRRAAAMYTSVGSVAGAVRARLLPGAERVFTVPEYLGGLIALQYGWFHRFRLAIRFVPLRVLHLLRAARRARTARRDHHRTSERSGE
ncbi:hypothetical protein [Actinacidiphila sp. bgisy144]|uniref:hypothetical protein n=1 Tax=Actinacidiphila sp. bgisy144 TaxID=3413791 RepID=UPI003EB6D30C